MNQPTSKIRVLLVDDDPSQLELIDTAIGSVDNSFTFETANSADRALELIHKQPFDCIVSNYIMPRMNGLEFCEKLRAERCETPFILFTCHDDQKVVERAFAVGVDHFLGKEPNLAIYSELAQQVKSLVMRRRTAG